LIQTLLLGLTSVCVCVCEIRAWETGLYPPVISGIMRICYHGDSPEKPL